MLRGLPIEDGRSLMNCHAINILLLLHILGTWANLSLFLRRTITQYCDITSCVIKSDNSIGCRCGKVPVSQADKGKDYNPTSIQSCMCKPITSGHVRLPHRFQCCFHIY